MRGRPPHHRQGLFPGRLRWPLALTAFSSCFLLSHGFMAAREGWQSASGQAKRAQHLEHVTGDAMLGFTVFQGGGQAVCAPSKGCSSQGSGWCHNPSPHTRRTHTACPWLCAGLFSQSNWEGGLELYITATHRYQCVMPASH